MRVSLQGTEWTHRQMGEGHVETEVVAAVMLSRARKSVGPPEAERGGEGFFSGAFGGSLALRTPGLRT